MDVYKYFLRLVKLLSKYNYKRVDENHSQYQVVRFSMGEVLDKLINIEISLNSK